MADSPISLAFPGCSQHSLALRINRQPYRLEVQAWVTLLDLLRDKLQLTGTKKGCDHGQCGACTVLVDGRRINACLTLAVMQDGRDITTVEGLAGLRDEKDEKGEKADADSTAALHPLQQAFIAHDAFQCGYCTPGQLCSAVGLINEGHAHTPDEVRELMSGNVCRCGAYPQITQAVCEVALGARPGAAQRTAQQPVVIGTVPA
jgi:xanthine dehydrogenase YagT iron-sulfur-binding subunit